MQRATTHGADHAVPNAIPSDAPDEVPNEVLRRLRNLLLCALPVLGLGGCAVVSAPTSTREVGQTVPDARSVAVESRNGSVALIHDPAATVMQVSAVIRCSGETEERAAARAAAATLTAVRDERGRVRIGVDFPARGSAMDSASIVIRAASLDGIEVATTNGRIELGAFGGQATLATSNGSIEIKDHAGPIDARSSNGAIRASGVLGPIVADTSNGRIEVALAERAEGDVTLETSNGAVLLELGAAWQGTVVADTSNGRVELEGGEVVGGDAVGGHVSGRSGTKTMTIGDAAKAKATIDTSNGRVIVRAAKK